MNIDSKLGVCIKSLNKEVTFQNEICEKICGIKVGEICQKGCMQNYESNSPLLISEGMCLIKNSNVDGNLIDAMVINDGHTLTTLLYPLTHKLETIEQNINEFKKYGLTNAELDIFGLVLKGMTNKEISKKLFIANSTLKTHLNNIYKKLPQKWQSLKNRN